MKIIDLLIKISNGEEVPNKIRVFNTNFNFDGRTNTYINEDGEDLFSDMYNWFNALNIKVETIEEKEIKKFHYNNLIWDKQARDLDYMFKDKIDELIDVINEMRDNE